MAAETSNSINYIPSQPQFNPFLGSSNERTRKYLSGSQVPLADDGREVDMIKTKKGRATQLKILEIALECFAEYGPEHTTVRLIAKKAGISIGLVHHYFPKSENIFVKVMEHITRSYLESVKDTPNDLPSQIKARMEYFVQNPLQFRCYALSFPYTLIRGELRLIHSQINKNFLDCVNSAVRGVVVSRDKVVNDQKVGEFTNMLLESQMGALMNYYFGQDIVSADEFLQKQMRQLSQKMDCFVSQC